MEEIEQFAPIFDFSLYIVSNFGRVFNKSSGAELIHSPTLQGTPTVGLMRAGVQYRRSVKGLVARAFVRGETVIFNTPIQLDGDKTNLRASNMVWRPRWFAWLYSNQFNHIEDWYYTGPIVDDINKVEYPNILEASVTNGVLCKEIRDSIFYEIRVFPTQQIYTMLSGKRVQ